MAVLRYQVSEVMSSDGGKETLSRFREDVIAGLTKKEKSLPCKYFYDEHGSKLFEQITMLEEYYPTRTELAIMQDNLQEIAESIGTDVNLIEFGSGSSIKTELLLAHASIRNYIPIDIAQQELRASAERIGSTHPELEVHPLIADYTEDLQLPVDLSGRRNVVYFPGSTIGNFEPIEAKEFLTRTLKMMGPSGALLIGVDLKKEKWRIERAYNDSQGVTAQFNLNMLDRINRELHPDPALRGFLHSAVYSEAEGRIEMRLIAQDEMHNSINGIPIHFAAGEAIVTEYSYKYTVAQFKALAASAGLSLRNCWIDSQHLFSLQLFEPASGSEAT